MGGKRPLGQTRDPSAGPDSAMPASPGRSTHSCQLPDIPSYPGEDSAPNTQLPVNSRANPVSTSEERFDLRPSCGWLAAPGGFPVIGMAEALPH